MLLQWRGGGEEFTTDLDVTSRMQFDAFGHLEQVESHANIAELGELFQLTGRVQDQGIDLVVHTQLPGLANDNPTELFRKRLELPPDALVVDALSPSPRLANLRVGQTWTFRSFRPFPPQRPWQLIKAEVTGTEAYLGAGDYESVFVVQFTDQTSSSLTTSATPFSKLWVRDDGTVVKQQLAMGSVQVDFERDERHDSTR